MLDAKQRYSSPSVEILSRLQGMSLLNSLSADIVFDDMEDGGEIEGTGI